MKKRSLLLPLCATAAIIAAAQLGSRELGYEYGVPTPALAETVVMTFETHPLPPDAWLVQVDSFGEPVIWSPGLPHGDEVIQRVYSIWAWRDFVPDAEGD